MGAGGGWGEWAPTSKQRGWCFVEASISGHSRKDWERILNPALLLRTHTGPTERRYEISSLRVA